MKPVFLKIFLASAFCALGGTSGFAETSRDLWLRNDIAFSDSRISDSFLFNRNELPPGYYTQVTYSQLCESLGALLEEKINETGGLRDRDGFWFSEWDFNGSLLSSIANILKRSELIAKDDSDFMATPALLVTSWIYMQRFFEKEPSFIVTQKNVYPFSMISLFLASKVLEESDHVLWNIDFAQFTKIPIRQFNLLELNFLNSLNWDLNITPQDFLKTAYSMIQPLQLPLQYVDNLPPLVSRGTSHETVPLSQQVLRSPRRPIPHSISDGQLRLPTHESKLNLKSLLDPPQPEALLQSTPQPTIIPQQPVIPTSDITPTEHSPRLRKWWHKVIRLFKPCRNSDAVIPY